MHMERNGVAFALLKVQAKQDRDVAHSRNLGLEHATGTIRGLFEGGGEMLGVNERHQSSLDTFRDALHELTKAGLLRVENEEKGMDAEVTLSGTHGEPVTFDDSISDVLEAVKSTGKAGAVLKTVEDRLADNGRGTSYQEEEVESILHVLTGTGFLRESVQPSFYGHEITIYHDRDV